LRLKAVVVQRPVSTSIGLLTMGAFTFSSSATLPPLPLPRGGPRRRLHGTRRRPGPLRRGAGRGWPSGSIRWRAANDRSGRETLIPINDPARRAIDRILQERPGVGEAWLCPGPGNPQKPIVYHLASRWLEEAEKLAGLATGRQPLARVPAHVGDGAKAPPTPRRRGRRRVGHGEHGDGDLQPGGHRDHAGACPRRWRASGSEGMSPRRG